MSKSKFRSVATVGAMTVALACMAPALASAQPTLGSSTGSGLIDDPIGTIQSGSAAIDPIGILQGGIGIVEDYLGGGSSGSGTPTQQCNGSTQSGQEGVTDTLHELGRPGPTSFVLAYETENVPDQIEVFYQGAPIANTGYVGDDLNEGSGSVIVNVPPGTATAVLVRVTGPSGTVWDYTVNCPN
ncbi:hypothetical protein ACNHUS_24790 [Actinomycetes bacterium M1A6_2h]